MKSCVVCRPKALASEAEAGIRIGGVVDRDFRSDSDAAALNRDHVVLALPVHEVENFFLHPPTLRLLLDQNGRSALLPQDLIRTSSDARAGSWIFQNAMTKAQPLPPISVPAKERAKALTWAEVDVDRNAAIQSIVEASGYDADHQRKLRGILEISANSYARKRGEDGLWKNCEGKQVLNEVARSAGFSGAPAMIQATFAAWAREGAIIPQEMSDFRAYFAAL
jgi:hypothetical protein